MEPIEPVYPSEADEAELSKFSDLERALGQALHHIPRLIVCEQITQMAMDILLADLATIALHARVSDERICAVASVYEVIAGNGSSTPMH